MMNTISRPELKCLDLFPRSREGRNFMLIKLAFNERSGLVHGFIVLEAGGILKTTSSLYILAFPCMNKGLSTAFLGRSASALILKAPTRSISFS